MKKHILLAASALLASIAALAGPAYPGRIVRTQPDGSTIGIYLHGDEWHHWMTDDEGNVVKEDEDGFIRVVTQTPAQRTTLQQKGDERRAKAMAAFKEAAAASKNVGSPKIPVLLVGFKDQAFTKTAAEFNAMLNTPGYSDNNAVGSVLDYYRDNSFGEFTPVFEVLGPVTLDNNMSYYGGNDSNGDDKLPEMALVHAAQKLDATTDFSRYDNDGDGTVDFVLFYFAGCDEAQGASSNAIWSHAWYLSASSNAYNSRTFDGVKLDRYFCTAELKGSSSAAGVMCSIGTTCHEFAHTLGLPDFYDADYSTNGSAANTYDFDLMANGAYNNNSTTPPYFTAEELWEVGWLSGIPELSSTGAVTMKALNYPDAKTYTAYKIPTSVTDEYFVLEVRGGTGWDAALPGGLIAYHVDRSSSYVSRWSANTVNNYSAHPCCYIVQPSNPTSISEFTGSTMNRLVFGGTYKTFSPTAWDGNSTGFQFTNITYANGVATFNVVNGNSLGITGTVYDSDNNPIAGVTISLEVGTEPQAVRKNSEGPFTTLAKKIFLSSKKRSSIRTKAAAVTATTDANGYYSIELDAVGTYNVTASLDGYVSQTAVVSVTSLIETQNFYLLREGEELPSQVIPFPDGDDGYIVGSSTDELMGQNMFPISEMAKYAGKQIKSVSFYLYGDSSTSYSDVYAIVDYGNTRKATVAVADDDVTVKGWTTVDVRDQELIIPSDQDLYIGPAFKGGYQENGYYYALGAHYFTEEDEEGNEVVPEWAANGWPYRGYAAEYNLTSTGTRYDWDLVFDIYITVGDYVKPDTGYNFIADPKKGSYSAGDVFELVLNETTGTRKPASAIEWLIDDEPVSGSSVTLTAGSHVIEARFTTESGEKKVVELELEVN